MYVTNFYPLSVLEIRENENPRPIAIIYLGTNQSVQKSSGRDIVTICNLALQYYRYPSMVVQIFCRLLCRNIKKEKRDLMRNKIDLLL